jgi:hypothetical protein
VSQLKPDGNYFFRLDHKNVRPLAARTPPKKGLLWPTGNVNAKPTTRKKKDRKAKNSSLIGSVTRSRRSAKAKRSRIKTTAPISSRISTMAVPRRFLLEMCA